MLLTNYKWVNQIMLFQAICRLSCSSFTQKIAFWKQHKTKPSTYSIPKLRVRLLSEPQNSIPRSWVPSRSGPQKRFSELMSMTNVHVLSAVTRRYHMQFVWNIHASLITRQLPVPVHNSNCSVFPRMSICGLHSERERKVSDWYQVSPQYTICSCEGSQHFVHWFLWRNTTFKLCLIDS